MYIYIFISDRDFIHFITDNNIIAYNDLQIEEILISPTTGKLIVGKKIPKKGEKHNSVFNGAIGIMQQLLVYSYSVMYFNFIEIDKTEICYTNN